jgi:hypothetical protein
MNVFRTWLDKSEDLKRICQTVQGSSSQMNVFRTWLDKSEDLKRICQTVQGSSSQMNVFRTRLDKAKTSNASTRVLMARRKWPSMLCPPLRPRATQPVVPTEPVVEPTSKDVHADLERMHMLPRPPREHKRARLLFRGSHDNYRLALFMILCRTHPGLKDIAKYRVAQHCWKLLSDYERQAWVAPTTTGF